MSKKKNEKMYLLGLLGFLALWFVFVLFGFFLKPTDVEHSFENHTLYLALHPFKLWDLLGIGLAFIGSGVLLGLPTLFWNWEVYHSRGKVPVAALVALGAIVLGAFLISV